MEAHRDVRPSLIVYLKVVGSQRSQRMFDPHLVTDVLSVVGSVLYTADFILFVPPVLVGIRNRFYWVVWLVTSYTASSTGSCILG